MRQSLALLLLFVGLLGWVGCDTMSSAPNASETPSEDGAPPTSNAGHIQVHLTDAPGDIAEAYVTVERVELVPSDEGSIIVLSDSTRRLDLLTLQNGVTETLADTTLPAGTYSQIRFIIGNDATIRLEDGSTPRLKVPSGPQTGIKIVVPEFTVNAEQDTVDVTLDFSVEDSFVKAGRSGKYIFKPTVKAESVLVNGQEEELVEVAGEITAIDDEAGTVAVEDIPFAITPDTRFVEDDGALSDFAVGDFVDVSGTVLDDGSLAAREVEAQGEDETERSVEARVEAIGDASLTLLGQEFLVTDATAFEDLSGLMALQAGDHVEVEFEIREDDGAKVALEIEREGSGDDA